jgi:CelD/BcsL family acetyltransferase involved in cellulose biosynthesis
LPPSFTDRWEWLSLNIHKAIDSELPTIDVAPFSASDIDAVTAAAHPAQAFLTSGWFNATGQSPVVIGARRPDGTAIAAFPLTDRSIGPFRVKEISGSYWPFRSIPLAENISDAELALLLRNKAMHAAMGRLFRFGPVYSDDPAASRLVPIAKANGWTVLRKPLATCYELDLADLHEAGPWPKGSTRRKNRARERKLAADGDLNYRFLIGTQIDHASMDAMATVEANSWLAKLDGGGDTKFRDPKNRAIWERLVADPALSQSLFASLMTIGETPIAFSFGLEIGNCRYYIANNYDEGFSKFGPGKLLLYKDFEFATDRGIGKISWGAGDAGYKTEMGAQPGPAIEDLLFVRGSLLGAVVRRFWERG